MQAQIKFGRIFGVQLGLHYSWLIIALLEKENSNYKLIATMTGMEHSHKEWHGETGLINQELLARYLQNAVLPIYYIAGPAGME